MTKPGLHSHSVPFQNEFGGQDTLPELLDPELLEPEPELELLDGGQSQQPELRSQYHSPVYLVRPVPVKQIVMILLY